MLLYLEGLLFGVPAIFFVGPVLFTLLQASLRFGFRAGFAVAAGIAFSDLVCVGLCYLGLAQFLTNPTYQRILGILGGLIFLGFGFSSLLRKPKPQAPHEISGTHLASLFGQGFLVNFVNPFVFSYWIGALSMVSTRHGLQPFTVVLVFSGAITTIFVTDALKALFAARLRHYIHSATSLWLQRFLGVCFLLGGAYLLWRILSPMYL